MRVLPILLTAALLFFSAGAAAGVFGDKTDRFTGSRVVAWTTIPSGAETFAVSTFAFYPKGQTKPYQYQVQLITYADSMQYYDCNQVDWLVDGQSAPYLTTKYSADRSASAAIERFDIILDRAALQKIATAKLVEFKVCGTESSINEADMAGLKRVFTETE